MSKINTQMAADLKAAEGAPMDDYGRSVAGRPGNVELKDQEPEKKILDLHGKPEKKAEEDDYIITIVDDTGKPTGELFDKSGNEIDAKKGVKEENAEKKIESEISPEVQAILNENRLLKEKNDILQSYGKDQEQILKDKIDDAQDSSDDYDPFDQASVDKHIKNLVSKGIETAIETRLAPIEKIMYNDMFEKSEQNVKTKYGEMYNSEKDVEAVVAIRQKYPGMSHEDAFKIHNHDRMQENGKQQADKDNQLVNSMTLSGGPGTRHLAPKANDVQLTKEELYAAKMTGCTPKEYADNKKLTHSR